MNSLILLKCIGEIEDSYIVSAQKLLFSADARQTKVIPFKKYMVMAAAVILALALVGCAIIFGLRHMKVGEHTDTFHTQEFAAVEHQEKQELISLQGFVGSAGYKAAKEWQQFQESYDRDGALLANADADDYQEPIEYMSYICYTQEMQDKIDDICAKYCLDILGPVYFADQAWRIFEAVKIRAITDASASATVDFHPGYYYGDGSFAVDGSLKLLDDFNPWPHPVNFQYRCVQKSSFDSVFLNVGDIDGYEQWNYTASDGTVLLLALSEEKALVIADKEAHFVSINITKPYYEGASGAVRYMDRAALEAVAACFDFGFEPQRPNEDSLTLPEWFDE